MIGVFLKIFNKGDLNFHLDHLDFWFDKFKDQNKYKIYLYNENVEFKFLEKYSNISTIINREEIIKNIECKNIAEDILNSKILNDKWKGAAFALCIPFFYLQEEYIWGIDSDDLKLQGNINYYLDRVEELIKQYNLPILSSDIYFSVPNNSWSFGITLAHKEKFKKILKEVLYTPVKEPGWGNNLDHMIDQYFKRNTEIYYISFTTPDKFEHCGKNGLHSWFDTTENMSACDLYGQRIQYANKNNRSILIK